LGGIEEISINEASSVLLQVLGKGTRTYLEPRHEVKHAIPSFQKSIDLLGFEHKTNLSEGLYKMWEWAKTQPNRKQFIWQELEIKKGIYSFWKNKK
jgi:UDP-glucose 4-epimerase